ncbi:hypothetical protein HDU85_002181 [Gaertneriomyces sp. JEL0708]|nr:hypothetical protein HDU85_002181 [Gaertneriomyces sp. JEL0708]
MDLGKNHLVSSAYDANLVPILPARREDQPSLDSAPPSLYWRRVRMMNTIILRMQHPRSGLERRDRKKMFKVYARTFLGNDLLDWVIEHCDFLSREEGARFCGLLFSEGYIISVDLADRFTADNNYAVYLLKRTSRSADKYVLADWEEERLRRAQEQLHGQWENVERTAGFHIKHEKSALSKPERRLYHLQEYSFWRTQRAQIPPGDREDDSRSRRTTTTEDAYIKTMKGQKLLDWLERKCESLNISLTVNRVKVSQASRALISRCEIWRGLDPMLDSTSTAPNPWLSEENSITAAIYAKEGWGKMAEPTYAEIKMWTTNFNDLMRDPVGVRHFYEFVQKEFSQENLEFYLKCRALDSVSSRKEYVDRARAIYEEFVKAGAPRELNLPSSDRSAIIAQFEALENASPGQAESLSYYVFADALKHILALMAKDSYVRFCNSDMLADALRRAGSQRDSWDETSRGSGTSTKKLTSTG